MNRVLLLAAGLFIALSVQAQQDTTVPQTTNRDTSRNTHDDTLRVGHLLIVRTGGHRDDTDSIKHYHYHHDYEPRNLSTNWLIFDIGFANYNDHTNYSSVSAQQFAPGGSSDWFKLRTGKSVDVNIWAFMQRLNLIRHVVNLKYGLGIELNNYRYESDIRFKTDPTKVIMDTIHYSKNKLAVDYVTVPVMLNFNFTPHRKNGYGFSTGVSFGYRYSSREKFKSAETGKEKTYNDFDLYSWKLSYIAELNLGLLKLYGSYASRSMFSKGLDMTPYTMGIRIGNW